MNHFPNAWLMLDTGATVAMTFVKRARTMASIERCEKNLDIHTMRITTPDGRSQIEIPMPPTTYWPSCIPTQDATKFSFIILGIQMLSKLQSLYYEINDGQISKIVMG